MLFLHIQCERGEKVSSPSVTIKRAEIEGLLDYSYALPEHPLLFLFLSPSLSLLPVPFLAFSATDREKIARSIWKV